MAKFIVLIFSIPICGLLGMLDGPGITIFYILYKVSWLLWKPSFLRSKKTLLSCTINIKHCTYVMLQQCLLKKNNTWVAVDYYAYMPRLATDIANICFIQCFAAYQKIQPRCIHHIFWHLSYSTSCRYDSWNGSWKGKSFYK